MYPVEFSEGAEEDLHELLNEDRTTASVILAVLDEIENQKLPVDEFLTTYPPKYTDKNYTVRLAMEPYEVDGLRLWSIKCYFDVIEKSRERLGDCVSGDSSYNRVPINYRVLFVYNMTHKRYIVLGILHRKVCYDTVGFKYIRIKKDYAEFSG